MIPFLGTAIGSFFVFFMRKNVNNFAQVSIQGISSGVMTAAAVWSLLIPAIELSQKRGQNPLVMTSLGFVSGVVLFIACERILELMRGQGTLSKRYGKSLLPCIAVALHNFPEGMAVGAVFAEVAYSSDASALSAAMALSLGIAIQNLPEGAIISVPLYADGVKRKKAFLLGVASGIVEPIGAVATIIAARIAVPILPFLLGVSAGAMIFAVLDCIFQREYQQESRSKSLFSLCFSVGFTIMMSLDVLLG